MESTSQPQPQQQKQQGPAAVSHFARASDACSIKIHCFVPLRPEPSPFTRTCLLRASGRQISQVPTGPGPIQSNTSAKPLLSVSRLLCCCCCNCNCRCWALFVPSLLLLRLHLHLHLPTSRLLDTRAPASRACHSLGLQPLPLLHVPTIVTPSSPSFFSCACCNSIHTTFCIYWFGVVSIRALHIAESVSTKRASINTIHHLVCFYHELQPKPVAPSFAAPPRQLTFSLFNHCLSTSSR